MTAKLFEILTLKETLVDYRYCKRRKKSIANDVPKRDRSTRARWTHDQGWIQESPGVVVSKGEGANIGFLTFHFI